MVGVSSVGVEMVVMSLLSGILTAVMVRLTLEAASLVVLWVVTVPPPDTTEAVVKGSGDEVTVLSAVVLLAAAWERVNMIGGGGFVSRCKNFLRVTWSESLTNMGRWRHFKR